MDKEQCKAMFARGDAIAPYPTTEDEATAAAMIAASSVLGCLHNEANQHAGDDEMWRHIAMVVESFTTAYLLEQLRTHTPDVADAAARGLWAALADGSDLAEFMAELARARGIDVAGVIRPASGSETVQVELTEVERLRKENAKLRAEREIVVKFLDSEEIGETRQDLLHALTNLAEGDDRG